MYSYNSLIHGLEENWYLIFEGACSLKIELTRNTFYKENSAVAFYKELDRL